MTYYWGFREDYASDYIGVYNCVCVYVHVYIRGFSGLRLEGFYQEYMEGHQKYGTVLDYGPPKGSIRDHLLLRPYRCNLRSNCVQLGPII